MSRRRVTVEREAPAASSGAWIIAALMFAGSGGVLGAGAVALAWWLS